MRLFYGLIVFILVWGLMVFTYDLFQGEMEGPDLQAALVLNPETDSFFLEKPTGTVRIVYASMFGPGEPVMRVRDKWMDRFETDYGAHLSADADRSLSDEERADFLAGQAGRIRRMAGRAGDWLQRLEQAGDARGILRDISSWLREENIPSPVIGAKRPAFIRQLLQCLSDLSDTSDLSDKIKVRNSIRVKVERRWQGRWVLSANRPRFLTGQEVPDIMVGSKMELLALIEDDYVIPLNLPLEGETIAPLDSPDTWGDPARTWGEAFIPAMLAEGKYTFIRDEARQNNVYIAPLWCNTNCIFYNKVLFEKAGVEKPPRTWSEFIAVCERLKGAGIAPLTADQHVYSDMWMNWLFFRVLGQEALEGTVTGIPENAAPAERKSEPSWTDPAYHEVFKAIRALRENNYFKEGFRGLTWPASQRGFASGDAAMMICGSWLVQELGGYKDIDTKGKFEIGCFSFPQWPGGRRIDQEAIHVSPYGLAVCRQGRATRHAIELVKYLSAHDHVDMVHQNAQISCMKDADFPPDLAGIADDFRTAPVVYNRTPNIYARRFNASVLAPLYTSFFMQEKDDSDRQTVEEFLEIMKTESENYLKGGGEEGFE